MRTIVLELTVEELEKLQEAVSNYQDEGPSPMGWQSDILKQVNETLNKAVMAKKNLILAEPYYNLDRD